MWMVWVRPAQPDAPWWPGRRRLAAIDAVAWPVGWVLVIQQAAPPVGVARPVLTALAVLAAVWRLHSALCENHRYRFTTWRWAKIAAGLMLVGLVMKAAMAVA